MGFIGFPFNPVVQSPFIGLAPSQIVNPVETGYLNAPPALHEITAANWEQKVLQEIARREAVKGHPITNGEKIAIMNAYRQVAGLPPVGFDLDEAGAAILNNTNPQTVPGVVADAFKPINASNNLITGFTTLASAANKVTEKAADIVGKPIENAALLVAGLAVIGILVYFGKR